MRGKGLERGADRNHAHRADLVLEPVRDGLECELIPPHGLAELPDELQGAFGRVLLLGRTPRARRPVARAGASAIRKWTPGLVKQPVHQLGSGQDRVHQLDTFCACDLERQEIACGTHDEIELGGGDRHMAGSVGHGRNRWTRCNLLLLLLLRHLRWWPEEGAVVAERAFECDVDARGVWPRTVVVAAGVLHQRPDGIQTQKERLEGGLRQDHIPRGHGRQARFPVVYEAFDDEEPHTGGGALEIVGVPLQLRDALLDFSRMPLELQQIRAQRLEVLLRLRGEHSAKGLGDDEGRIGHLVHQAVLGDFVAELVTHAHEALGRDLGLLDGTDQLTRVVIEA